jgi:small-conductance mechanosensitive channel
MQRLLPILLILLAVLLLPLRFVAAQDTPAEQLQSWEANLAAIEKELAADADLPEERYGHILQQVGLLIADARALRDAQQLQAQPIRGQLASLGAPPADGQPPEDASITETRGRLSEELSKFQGRITRAELAITRAQAVQGEIGSREQASRQRRLAVRGPSPLLPATWEAALTDPNVIYKSLHSSALQWWRNLQIAEMDTVTIASALGILLVAGVLAFPLRRWVLTRWGPRPEIAEPSYTRRILAAIAGAVARVLLPALAIIALHGLFVITLPAQIEDSAFPIFVLASGGYLVLFFIVSGLSIACLSPDYPAWRLVPVPAKAAIKLGRRVVTGALCFLILSIVINAVSAPRTMTPSESFASILSLVASLIAVIVFLPGLRAKYWVSDTHFKSRLSWLLRGLAALAIIGSLIAALLGYASMAKDLLISLSVTATLIGMALLLREIIGEAIRLLMTPGNRFYDAVSRTTGLSPESGRRLAFWLRLMADIVLWPPVVYIVLIACGMSSTLLNSWTVRFLTQIRLGDLNLSLIDVAAALLTVIVGFLLVGGVKRWVRERVMPNTQLDLGMQNSISTGIGYVAGLIVLMIAIMVLGIDFSSIALVAGALSVGIGFGLRTVVENFVAGLLLLIERPIKTGDWIVVGTTEGIVKSISVRSTEIETFDRASVIVPNSALIASPVINWTHKNRIARVIVRLSVVPGADARALEHILLACAAQADHVMKHPAPSVIFRAIGEEKLDFELRCFVSDTDYYLSTLSAINFAIDEALRRERITPLAQSAGPAPAAEPHDTHKMPDAL